MSTEIEVPPSGAGRAFGRRPADRRYAGRRQVGPHGAGRRSAGRLIAALLSTVLMLAGGLPVRALDANGQLEDAALQSRFENIAKNLRCLVCQNESIADSNVELASDLRRQVREMLVAGKSDDEIFKFMTDRYGEFVRFNPPVDRKTALIWGAPFIVVLLGVVIVFRIVRGRSRMPLDDEPSPGPL